MYRDTVDGFVPAMEREIVYDLFFYKSEAWERVSFPVITGHKIRPGSEGARVERRLAAFYRDRFYVQASRIRNDHLVYPAVKVAQGYVSRGRIWIECSVLPPPCCGKVHCAVGERIATFLPACERDPQAVCGRKAAGHIKSVSTAGIIIWSLQAITFRSRYRIKRGCNTYHPHFPVNAPVHTAGAIVALVGYTHVQLTRLRRSAEARDLQVAAVRIVLSRYA